MLPSELLTDLPDPADCDLSEFLTMLKNRLCAIGCLTTDVRCAACGTSPETFTAIWQAAGCNPSVGAITLEMCATEPVLWVWTGSEWRAANFGSTAFPPPSVRQNTNGRITGFAFPPSTSWNTLAWPILGGSDGVIDVASGQKVIIQASMTFVSTAAPGRVRFRVRNKTLDRLPNILSTEMVYSPGDNSLKQSGMFVAADDPGPGSYEYSLQARKDTTGYTTDTFWVVLSAFTIG